MGFDVKRLRVRLGGKEDTSLRRLVFLLFVLWAGPSWADRPAIAGEEGVLFQEARQAWLDGDDLVALRALGGLAGQGNTAAQILLARIAEETHMHRHVTGDMDRADRIALLRQPEGLSGVSWLEAARETSDLADALVQRNVAYSWGKDENGQAISPEATEAVRVLLDYGEVQLATEVAFKLADSVFLRETLTFLEDFGQKLSPVADILKARSMKLHAAASGAEDAMIEVADQIEDETSEATRLALGQIIPWQVSQDEGLQNLIIRQAELVGDWAPMRELCEISCPQSYETCLLAGATSLGYGRRFPFDSPLQSLVPNAEYWRSARIRGDSARRMTEIPQAFEAASAFDQCFAETVSALAQ